MRRLLERWARHTWSEDAGWVSRAGVVLLGPASALYRVGLAHQQWHQSRSVQRVEGIHVISVGNLAVGGTGKTPVAAWLVRRLLSGGHRPALVSRGYGADELLLHARWNPEAKVVAQADRVDGVREARDAGSTVAVLDDGFQHRRLARDVDLVLLAAEDPFPGHVLPLGPYREPATALTRADALVVTRRTAAPSDAHALAADLRRRVPGAAVGMLSLEPGSWLTLDGAPAQAPTGPVLAVAAVARAVDFASNVASATGEHVELLAFPDHHEYTERDVAQVRKAARGRTLVVTEKDAVKLAGFASTLPPTRVLSQEIRWDSGMDAVCRLVDATLERTLP